MTQIDWRCLNVAVVGLLWVTSGCARSTAPAVASIPGPGDRIKHVIIIVQENRTFDNVFSGFPGADAPTAGRFKDRTVELRSIRFAPAARLNHYYEAARASWANGKMNGFNGGFARHKLPWYFPYAHLERDEVTPYWDMASEYALLDHMFPTEFGSSFPNHLALISSTTNISPDSAEVNNPFATLWNCDAPDPAITYLLDTAGNLSKGPRPCFSQFNTMADTLDMAGLSWKYYSPPYRGTNANRGGAFWTAFAAIRRVRYGQDFKRVVNVTDVLADARNGNLPALSWVIPDWLWSDHPAAGSDMGPSWVSAVVNAVGEGPDWSSTAIVVIWDDWGGWYDDVAPPQEDFRGLGIRVGCLLVSPYVKPHVSHQVYEFGSILRFVEDVFHLRPMDFNAHGFGYTDVRAAGLENEFDFTQPPRPFKPIPAKYPPSAFLNQRPTLMPPDTDL